MKKLILLFVSVLLLLSACGGEPEEFVWPDVPPVEQKNDSLTVYCVADQKASLQVRQALQLYRVQHPDITVTAVTPDVLDPNELNDVYQQAAAEIMAGEGPDILILDDSFLDIEKLVYQGIFADMEPFFAADGFDWEPYNQTVMDGGVWDGRRYAVPLGYDFLMLVTSQTALEETGFDIGACGDWNGFVEETARYMEDSSQTRQLFNNPSGDYLWAETAGIRLADYAAKAVDLSSPDFKTGIYWYQTTEEKNPATFFQGNILDGAAAVRDGNALWAWSTQALETFYYNCGALKTIDEPVMLPIRDLNGGIQAQISSPVVVRGNSENLQNAYEFIKVLLGHEVQSYVSWGDFSVLDEVNYEIYQQKSQGKLGGFLPGTSGFYSTTDEYEAVDWPEEDEFEELMGYVDEIDGTYYFGQIRMWGRMWRLLSEGVDYDESLKEAEKAARLYITE